MVVLEALEGALQRARRRFVPRFPKSPIRRNPAVGIAVLAIFCLFLSGCGGGNASSDQSNGSPPPPPPPPQDHFAIATYHNDTSRSGINSQETTLTPANVNVVSFGKLAAVPVQGAIYAQPLYIADVTMSDGKSHNLAIVVTEHDQVYAIDTASYQVMWQRNFLDSQGLITPGLGSDLFCGEFFNPEIGITGTPVIDPSSATLYLVAETRETQSGQPQYYQRLYALNLVNGQDSASPTVIATPSGSGQFGTATFDPEMNFQRSALMLENGNVYVAWASQCEAHAGWLMSFSSATLQMTAAWTPDPSGLLGGLWMSGGGPLADSDGNIFVAVANGWSDAQTGGANYGDSVVRLDSTGGRMNVADYFMPYDYEKLYNDDLDLGSGTPMLFPTQTGAAHPHLMITGGKEGTIYLLDRDNLGKWNANNDDQVLQTFNLQQTGVFSAPLFWNNTLYYGLSILPVQAFTYDPATQTINTTPTSSSPTQMAYPGISPTLSANGTQDAILWAIENTPDETVLRAYDATNLSNELYNTEMSPDRDNPGGPLRFTVPTVAGGEVFVGTNNELDIYGELPH